MWLRQLLRPIRNIRQFFTPVAMAEEDSDEPVQKKAKVERQFDSTKYAKRHILMMVSYLGWDYSGLVTQVTVDKTIEAALYAALAKTKLVESIATANYRRCGRTDKGVSAFRQVVSFDIRSLASDGEGVFLPEGHSPFVRPVKKAELGNELNYMEILNRVLPDDIRVLAWAPVPADKSARYDCLQRTYKYFFPRGDLDIEVMRSAGQLLVGTNDLRNFCKFDLSKNRIKETRRTITSVTIEEADSKCSGSPFDMFVLTISAPSFLWHQIRNIVTVLVLVGQGKEQPDVVTQLLDVETYPRRPQYSPASEIPLILYDCQFDNVKWHWDNVARKKVISKLQSQWMELAIKAQMLKSMCEDLARETTDEDATFSIPIDQVIGILPGDKRRKYKSILKRITGRSMEEMQAKCEARKARKEEARRESDSD